MPPGLGPSPGPAGIDARAAVAGVCDVDMTEALRPKLGAPGALARGGAPPPPPPADAFTFCSEGEFPHAAIGGPPRCGGSGVGVDAEGREAAGQPGPPPVEGGRE